METDEQLQARARELQAELRALGMVPREKACTLCGTAYVGTARSKYCSRACRNRAFRTGAARATPNRSHRKTGDQQTPSENGNQE